MAKPKLFDGGVIRGATQALDFIANVLESSTEYSIIGIDLDGAIVLWNEGARRLYGHEPEEVIGVARADLLHTPEDIATDRSREIHAAALRDGKWEGIIERVRKDGRRFMARVVVTVRRDATGEPIGYLLISKDISHELLFSEGIRQSKLLDSSLLRSPDEALAFIGNILESSTEYSVIGTDLDGRILLWNEGARRLYGYEPEEVVGKANIGQLHVPEDVKTGQPGTVMHAALEDGKWEGTIDRLRKDGRRFTARVVITPRRDAGGTPVGYLLISKDISDEIRLTGELQATQFYTRSLIESNIDALATTDPLGIITDVNQQMEALTRASRDELIGTPFRSFHRPRARRRGRSPRAP